MTTTLSPTMGSALPDLGTPYSQRTVDIIRTLGPTRILGLASAVASVLAILIYVAVMVGTPDYDVLFAKLPVETSGAIVKKLEASGERYRLEDGGSTILVDKSNVARLRVMAAESKLISPGSLGYELLDRVDSMTTTNSLFQVNRIRALEGELARTIAAVEGIESARVHLVIPMRELFSQSGQESRASIVLKATGDRTVSKRSVEAIQQIVAGSVRDLAAARVAIMDTKGNLLARGDGDAQSSVSAGVFERKMDFERRTREGIERMLEQYVGLGRVRADVTAEFNLTSVSRSSETFDPRGRVERSIQTVEEAANRENTRQGRDVSVRNNLPEG
ncbi:MAG: flagellar M-ring protein FliF, partial [Alphaproteobacteria bacterium]|nr:flagellar M-ring protein FliF [Alphaproteobacteria bacterium]